MDEVGGSRMMNGHNGRDDHIANLEKEIEIDIFHLFVAFIKKLLRNAKINYANLSAFF